MYNVLADKDFSLLFWGVWGGVVVGWGVVKEEKKEQDVHV